MDFTRFPSTSFHKNFNSTVTGKHLWKSAKKDSKVNPGVFEGEVLTHTDSGFAVKFYLKRLHLVVPSLFFNVIWGHMLLHANVLCSIIVNLDFGSNQYI